MSQFLLTQGAGQKLEFAVRRNGGTTDDIEYLSIGPNFGAVTSLRTGRAKLVKVIEMGSEDDVIKTASTTTACNFGADGNFHFTIPSNGMTWLEWEQHFKHRDCPIDDYVADVLRRASESQAPTMEGTPHHIVVRPGRSVGYFGRITTQKIRVVADKEGWLKPHWEIACLICDTLTDSQWKQMDMESIVIMHEPVGNRFPNLLSVRRYGDKRYLGSGWDKPGLKWNRKNNFAFEVA